MVDPNLFTTVSDNTLLPFGQNLLTQGDDNSEQFDISEIFENGFSFGTRNFTELFLQTNGGVTFLPTGSTNIRNGIENFTYAIAPFADDLDNRTLPPGADPGIYFDINTGRDSVVATWVGVGIFSNNISEPNTFQMELMDLGGGDAEIIFRYSDMGNSNGEFQIGAVADGSPNMFLRGRDATEVLGDASDMDTMVGNTGVAGVWQMRVIDGQLQIDDFLGDDVTGNGNGNTINGTDLYDKISGGGGDDTINGLKGIDRLNGDAGQDTINGGEDDDILHGNDDNDTLRGDAGDDMLFGDAGDDRLEGGSGINELDGGAGADTLVGTGGQSFASYGSSSSGVIVNLSSTGSNTGDALGDTYSNITDVIGSSFDDQISGTNNDANTLRGGGGSDAIDGLNGSDVLFGDEGDDNLTGGGGTDTLIGGVGADILNGGSSDDTASYQESTVSITADLVDSSVNTGEAAGDTYISIEDLTGGMADDMLFGTASNNDLEGLDGNDMLIGRDGTDRLEGGEGDDILNGGLGTDTLRGDNGTDSASYADATTGLTADLSNSGNNTGEATGDTYNSIEGLIGSAFSDILTGDGNSNTLVGGDGADTLTGNNGNDTLKGGADSDRLFGGSGVDTADYSDATSAVSASLFDPNSNTGDARGDTYSSIEQLFGTEFGDTLGDNTGGGHGLFGFGGDDMFIAQGGSDTYSGGDGIDTVTFENVSTFVTIDLETSADNRGSAAGSNFVDIENLIGTTAADDLLGNAQDNMLVGGGNIDTLNGRDGDDILDGGVGNDTLTGGDGADMFIVSAGMGDDVVTDFTLGTDMLDYSALTMAERQAVTFSTNGAGDRVVNLADGSSMTLTGVTGNSAPTGLPTVSGTFQQNETLTVATDAIADADGLGAFSIQWLRGGTAIGGSTGSTYTLAQADVGQRVTAQVSYTDDFGTVETLNSDPAAVSTVGNVNDAPTGSITINGTATEGAILTASSTLADADGLGALNYQWLRDGTAVGGATAATYTLVQADVGAQMSVRASYTDGGGTDETASSAPTAAVANVNDAPTGGIAISGTAEAGAALTASSTLADEDGLGTLSYQWLRDGSAVGGATAATYTLTQADIGARMSVRASYTDGGGTAEAVTSAASAVIEQGFETGTENANTYPGTSGNDSYNGLGGDDIIVGGGGSDTLLGGAGDDFLLGGEASGENQAAGAQVYRIYQATLDRVPDTVGFEGWVNAIESGSSSLQSVVTGFTNSGEFQNTYGALNNTGFVTLLYNNVLERAPDQGGLNGWLDAIANGASRAQVVTGFSESGEFQNRTSAEAVAYAEALDGRSATEFYDDVYRLYQATLDRAPDAVGLAGWGEQLADGRAYTEVAGGFTNSGEFRNIYGNLSDSDFVDQLYRNVLDREADAGGRQGWLNVINGGGSREDVVQGFAQSGEFVGNTASDFRAYMKATGGDTLDGGVGDDTLYGGTGADTDIIDASEDGSDTVLQLDPWDTLQFEGFGYSSATDARAQMSAVGPDVRFADQGVTITFAGADLATMQEVDYLFE